MVSAGQKGSTTEGESSCHCWREQREEKAKKTEGKKELVANKANSVSSSGQMSTALRATRV